MYYKYPNVTVRDYVQIYRELALLKAINTLNYFLSLCQALVSRTERNSKQRYSWGRVENRERFGSGSSVDPSPLPFYTPMLLSHRLLILSISPKSLKLYFM